MTTITIERAFLIKVLDHLDIAQSLLERSQHHAKIAAMYKELRAALAAPATAPEQQECKWMPYDDDFIPGTYESQCGELWSFIDGGPAENRVKYCHGCGKPVVLEDKP